MCTFTHFLFYGMEPEELKLFQQRNFAGEAAMLRGIYLLILIFCLDHILSNGSYSRAIFKGAKYQIAQWMN